jgi:acylphosphatase
MPELSESTNDAQRREIHFWGNVQGVGFRYTTRAIAARYDVRGFVKNVSDGRVLLVVEGLPATLDRFLAAVEAEMQRHIDDRQVNTSPATGEFARFEVRY